MKIGLFTDTHFTLCPPADRPYLSDAPDRVAEAMEHFSKERVDVIVCLGDFVDLGKNHAEELNNWRIMLSIIRRYDIPFFILPGNHDYEVLKGDEFCAVSGMPGFPFAVNVGDKRLIFLDACYKKSGLRYDAGGMLWNDCSLPTEQIDFLKNTLSNADRNCIVFLHQDLDESIDHDYLIAEHKTIKNLIASSKKVKFVFSGHYHAGAECVSDGVRYITLPSMTESAKNEYRVFDI